MTTKNLALDLLKKKIKGTKFKTCRLALYIETDGYLVQFSLPNYPLSPTPSVELQFKPLFGDEFYWFASEDHDLLKGSLSKKILSSFNLGVVYFETVRLNLNREISCEDYVELYFKTVENLLIKWENYSLKMFDTFVNDNMKDGSLVGAEAVVSTYLSRNELDTALSLSKKLSSGEIDYRGKHYLPNYIESIPFIDFIARMDLAELEEFAREVRSSSRFAKLALD